MGNRFKGWSQSDIDKLNKWESASKERAIEKAIGKKKKQKQGIDYIGIICDTLHKEDIDYIREYKFIEDRRFRFDLAIPKYNIAIEWEGAIWKQGRHTRGKGYANDCKKYNLATMYGWKLLRYTTEDAKKNNWEVDIVKTIKELMFAQLKEKK
jgi:hypothetical protein